MKKKLLATVLTLALSLTIVQPSTIYAADLSLDTAQTIHQILAFLVGTILFLTTMTSVLIFHSDYASLH